MSEKINPYLTIPVSADWDYAVKCFNDESRDLGDWENGGSKLCPFGEACEECAPSDDCYCCILDMQYHSSGKDIYPETKRKDFAIYAGSRGHKITRKGYEQYNCKNPLDGVQWL